MRTAVFASIIFSSLRQALNSKIVLISTRETNNVYRVPRRRIVFIQLIGRGHSTSNEQKWIQPTEAAHIHACRQSPLRQQTWCRDEWHYVYTVWTIGSGIIFKLQVCDGSFRFTSSRTNTLVSFANHGWVGTIHLLIQLGHRRFIRKFYFFVSCTSWWWRAVRKIGVKDGYRRGWMSDSGIRYGKDHAYLESLGMVNNKF